MVCASFTLSGLGPIALIFSVKSATSFANLGASAEETQSMANLSGFIPASSSVSLITPSLALAL
jgi:hypothetical protein